MSSSFALYCRVIWRGFNNSLLNLPRTNRQNLKGKQCLIVKETFHYKPFYFYSNSVMDKFVTRTPRTKDEDAESKDNKKDVISTESKSQIENASPSKSDGIKEKPEKAVESKRVTRDMMVKHDRELFLAMSKLEKRKLYKCGKRYVELEDISTWKEIVEEDDGPSPTKKEIVEEEDGPSPTKKSSSLYSVDEEINNKVSIYRGDITTFEIDAIVNAANGSLLGGGGVDGAIHSAAGSKLRSECATLQGCDSGDAKITAGYKLPCRYVIHTVGPIGENPHKLKSCYDKCFKLMKEHKIRSIAFPCISTGIYGYPNESAAQIAMKCAREFLEKNKDDVDRIIFCLFLSVDVKIYRKDMHKYFPV